LAFGCWRGSELLRVVIDYGLANAKIVEGEIFPPMSF
jgi:hypothetical protein